MPECLFRKGARNHGVPVEVAVPVLKQLHDEGRLNSRVVVDESTPKEAPLHPCFEWDDAVAADNYRLKQASTLIRDIRVIEEVSTAGREAQQRAEEAATAYFVGVPDKGANTVTYRVASELVHDPDGFDRALLHLRKKLGEAQRAFDDLLHHLDTEDAEHARRVALLRQSRDLQDTVIKLAAQL